MDSPTFLSGRPSKNTLPMTGKEHAVKFGDSRVSLLDVLKKARPYEITTQALEERAELEPSGPVAGDQPLKKFTEEDWYRIREDAFHTPVPPAEIKRREQQSARDQRAQRRSQKQPVAPQSGGVRRSSRRQSRKVAYEASPPDNPSSEDSQDSFVASSGSEEFLPPRRGVNRKRTVTFKDTKEKVTEPVTRRTRKVLADSDDEMAEATGSRSRSNTPVPPIKKHSKHGTTLADSDEEMGEASMNRSRSLTPLPRVRKRSTRRTTLADSDDEMGGPSVSRSRSVTPAPAVKRRKVEGKQRVTLADSDDEME
ncbi:hypothetical protein KCU81_g7116, partial [Aureobasidium melanogenum]|uniref:Uncharacterized protein n=1 Tax=Aureobasidium melanogenum (strain CBS 110374) TaxID=1043003 RepID=A0A074VUE1_AURM1